MGCRYSELAAEAFPGQLVYQHGQGDYQGSAEVLVALDAGGFAHYAWSWGSCSGCDTWEAAEMSDAEIIAEMKQHAVYFEDGDVLARYCVMKKITGEPEGALADAYRAWCQRAQ